jgi:hypothetical protein
MFRMTGAAVVLALFSAVPVAWSFLVRPPDSVLRNAGYVQGPIDWQPMAPLAAFALALAVVIPAAVVGGMAGGLVWRWRRFAGSSVALATAWATGILILPIAAAVLGLHLRTGIVCLAGCDTLLRDDHPFGGPYAYANFLAGTFAFVWSLVLPVLVFLVVVRVLFDWARGRPAARPSLPLILLVGAFAVAHGIAVLWFAGITSGGLVPYVVLSVGVIAWAAWMDDRDSKAGSK